MNRIKRTVNKDILKMIYNALIVPHLNYGSLCWGFSALKLSKLQKRAVRVITLSKYNAHSQPIFKSLGILNTNDMFKLNAAKFIYKYYNGKLPIYFSHILEPHTRPRAYNTRHALPHRQRPKRNLTENSIRYYAANLLNTLPDIVTQKIHTHSLKGFSNYLKKYILSDYSSDCNIINCYICQS